MWIERNSANDRCDIDSSKYNFVSPLCALSLALCIYFDIFYNISDVFIVVLLAATDTFHPIFNDIRIVIEHTLYSHWFNEFNAFFSKITENEENFHRFLAGVRFETKLLLFEKYFSQQLRRSCRNNQRHRLTMW